MSPEHNFAPGRSTAAAPTTRPGPHRQGGFSLVEVIVAIALFGIAMSSIAALTFAVTRQSTATVGTVERTAALEARINDLFSIPYASLAARAGCTTITTMPLPRTECITVDSSGVGRRLVTLTVNPTDGSIYPASVIVERTSPPAQNPFRVVR